MATSPHTSLTISEQPLPLRTDADGVARVGNTRVTLETVVASYRAGATAEQIADDFPTLRLADIHSVLGYVLDHPAEVDAYLSARKEVAKTVREQIDSIVAGPGIRQRLQSRNSPQSANDAQTGG